MRYAQRRQRWQQICLWGLLCCLVSSPSLSGNSTVAEHPEEMIRALVARKQAAMVGKDKDTYLSLLNEDDKEFYQEQTRCFEYYLDAIVTDYTLDIHQIEHVDDHTYLVTLQQEYDLGEERIHRSITYIEKYIKTDKGWRDADLNFSIRATDHYLIKYMPSIPTYRIAKIAREAEHAYTLVTELYGEEPREKSVIKIYTDQELLRQSVKITIARLFYGWGEPGESVKMFLRPNISHSYVPLLAHELVHKITLTQSNNFPYWFAEGLAVFYGSFNALGGTWREQGWHQANEYDHSIAWMEQQNPESYPDDASMFRFHGTSGMIVKYIYDVYGHEKPKELVRELSTYPQLQEGLNVTRHQPQLNSYMHHAIKVVLGVSMEEFDARWMEWITRQ